MEMEAFLAQSPDVIRLRDHIADALLAVSTASRCFRQAGAESATTADLRGYLTIGLHELEAARALVPAG